MGASALKESQSLILTCVRIPIVVSGLLPEAEEDIVRSYDLGVKFLRDQASDLQIHCGIGSKVLGRYWFEVVELPPDEN